MLVASNTKCHILRDREFLLDLPKFLDLHIILLIKRNRKETDVLDAVVGKKTEGWHGGE